MGYKPPMNWRTISQPSTGKSMGESHLVPITYSTKLLLKKAACMMFCGHFNLMWVHIRNMTIKKNANLHPLSDHFRSLFRVFCSIFRCSPAHVFRSFPIVSPHPCALGCGCRTSFRPWIPFHPSTWPATFSRVISDFVRSTVTTRHFPCKEAV